MNDLSSLPPNLAAVVGGENVEFAVLAERKEPIKNARGLIIFGSLWLAFVGFFLVVLLGPLLLGEKVRVRRNGITTTASLQNFGSLAVPLFVLGLFLLVGIAFLVFGIRMRRQKGGHFVGTPTRLIQQNEDAVLFYNWEQFSGNAEVSINNGDLSLQLRTGKWRTQKNGPDRFVPDVVHLSGIPDVLEVERICRQRILEHDPTPPYRP